VDHGSIYDAVRRRTRKAFGFPVNLHRFRHAAATFWSTQDPENVRGAKDLLGKHRSRQPKSTTSWRSHGSPATPWLELLTVTNEEPFCRTVRLIT
jgi:hypothetical protein